MGISGAQLNRILLANVDRRPDPNRSIEQNQGPVTRPSRSAVIRANALLCGRVLLGMATLGMSEVAIACLKSYKTHHGHEAPSQRLGQGHEPIFTRQQQEESRRSSRRGNNESSLWISKPQE